MSLPIRLNYQIDQTKKLNVNNPLIPSKSVTLVDLEVVLREDFGLTDGVGRQALRMASELECRGVYLGSCRMGCILKGCLLFIDIMIAEVREGRCKSSSLGSVLVL